MTFRYRGFYINVTDPPTRPYVATVHDPMDFARDFDPIASRASIDAAVTEACAFVDGICDGELARVAEAIG